MDLQQYYRLQAENEVSKKEKQLFVRRKFEIGVKTTS
jgi:hypothetical protein